MTDRDQQWIDALKSFLGGGIVPYFKKPDGSIDAAKTINHFCMLKGCSQIGEDGEQIPVEEWYRP